MRFPPSHHLLHGVLEHLKVATKKPPKLATKNTSTWPLKKTKVGTKETQGGHKKTSRWPLKTHLKVATKKPQGGY